MDKLKLWIICTLLLVTILIFMYKTTLADNDLNRCISFITAEAINTGQINEVTGIKKFLDSNSIWYVLLIKSVNKLNPEKQVICHSTSSGWEIVDYYNPIIPEDVMNFYIGYISSRQPDFDYFSMSIFIGDKNAEVYSKSNSQIISMNELLGFSNRNLNLIEAEILARHGAIFNDPILKTFFNTRAWYKPNKAFANSMLSEIERKNLNTIRQYRQKLNDLSFEGITGLFFGETTFKEITRKDINGDKKEEILLVPLSSEANVYNKALILRKEKNNEYSILLKIYSNRITGKDEEIINLIPKNFLFKVSFQEDQVYVDYVDTNQKPIYRIKLPWLKRDEKYYLLINP